MNQAAANCALVHNKDQCKRGVNLHRAAEEQLQITARQHSSGVISDKQR